MADGRGPPDPRGRRRELPDLVDPLSHSPTRPVRRADFIVDTQKVAHNAYLQAWAETGIIGLALFLAVILGLLSCSLKAIRGLRT